jgi:glycosyltransferase involved in cell wall biosynthesis
MSDPDVTVVLCTYNRAKMLRNALQSVTLQDTRNGFAYEILVVDNSSTDNTRSVVAEVASDSPVPIRYVQELTEGVVPARNRGVSEARGMWLAFFDDDQLAGPNWLRELLLAASLTKSRLVGGTTLPRLPASHPLALGPIARNVLGEHPYVGTARLCQGKSIPSTGNMLVAREVFDSIGLFDTSMLDGGEDTDFVRRARASGITVSIAPTATIHHIIPASRVTPDYLRWKSIRTGYQFAALDLKYFGRASTLARAVARIGQATLVNFPLLIFAGLMRNPTSCLDRRCLLWRAVGYVKGAASLAAPRLFKRSRFLSKLNFRKGRTACSNS